MTTKSEMLALLDELEKRVRRLRAEVKSLKTQRVNKKSVRNKAVELADFWAEKIRSPLEHKFKLPSQTIGEYSKAFKHLWVLSRPNNLRKSYLSTLGSILRGFQDRLVLPVREQQEFTPSSLAESIKQRIGPSMNEYLKEAVGCIENDFYRAGVVLAWCAVIDRIQRKIQELGFEKFNKTSTGMKNKKSGRFKKWNKELKISTLAELQEVFDSDLIWVLEGLDLIDSNQGNRLRTSCFQLRNQCAHPGLAPVSEPNVEPFFSDITAIVLNNPNFKLR